MWVLVQHQIHQVPGRVHFQSHQVWVLVQHQIHQTQGLVQHQIHQVWAPVHFQSHQVWVLVQHQIHQTQGLVEHQIHQVPGLERQIHLMEHSQRMRQVSVLVQHRIHQMPMQELEHLQRQAGVLEQREQALVLYYQMKKMRGPERVALLDPAARLGQEFLQRKTQHLELGWMVQRYSVGFQQSG
jgi:hypothetical protein